MKYEHLVMLLFLTGCVSHPDLRITGFEETSFDKRINVPGNPYNLYTWENSSAYKTVKEFSLSDAEIDEHAHLWEISVESVFKPAPAPYPGVVTQNVECPEYYLPVKTNGSGNLLFSYEIFTNPRGIIGVCSEDLVGYHCLFNFLICHGKLYELEYCFNSTGEKHVFEEFKKMVKC